MKRQKKSVLFYLAMDKDAGHRVNLSFGDLGLITKYHELFKEYQTALEKNSPINPSTGRKARL